MIRTIEEAIIHAEEVANDYEEMIGDYALDSEKLAKCAKNQRQIAAWLRELKERRKAPEIVRCKDCRHYEWMSNRIPEEQTWHCHCWDADTGKDDFCSYAERRTE